MQRSPIANGIRTDHPVPGLPFVDDSLLDLTNPSAIEAIGRRTNHDMWGRTDLYRMVPDAWRAFTTDPTNTDYAWVVIHHPDNGNSVLLFHDDDAVAAYSYRDFDNGGTIPLIVRAGGYWSDGEEWRRPTSMIDPVTNERTWDEPRTAVASTARDAMDLFLRGPGGDGRMYTLDDIVQERASKEDFSTWVDQSFPAWVHRRPEHALPLDRCVIGIEARELHSMEVLDNSQAAARAGVETSTWRAYVSRGTAPEPNLLTGSPARAKAHWAVPVVDAWIARRDREESERVASQGEIGDRFTYSVVNRIRDSLSGLNRRMLKANGAGAVRMILYRKVLGIAVHHYASAEMHSAWMADEFADDEIGFGPSLPNTVIDQVIALMWLDPDSAEEAIRRYVTKGVERGHRREGLEEALSRSPQVLDIPGGVALVERALRPRWE